MSMILPRMVEEHGNTSPRPSKQESLVLFTDHPSAGVTSNSVPNSATQNVNRKVISNPMASLSQSVEVQYWYLYPATSACFCVDSVVFVVDVSCLSCDMVLRCHSSVPLSSFNKHRDDVFVLFSSLAKITWIRFVTNEWGFYKRVLKVGMSLSFTFKWDR